MARQKNIPNLRFPKFEREWEENRIGKLFSISAGGDIPKNNVSTIQDNIFKYPIYANAEKDKGLFGYSNIYRIDSDVVTIAGRGVNVGIAHARKEKFYPIVRLLVLEPKIKSSVDFFEYAFNGMNFYIESTGVPQLTAPQISTYHIFYPTFPEQQKIASFFTVIDQKISHLKRKLSLLEQYKKGVMQKIFSQEIRFKDDNGQEFPKWEKRKIQELFRITRGNVLATNNLKLEKELTFCYPVYSSQTTNNGLLGYYNDYLFEDCITWTTDGANAGDVNYRKGKFYCTNVCGVLESKEGLANQCVAEILNSIARKHVAYVGNPKLMNNVMAGIEITIPTSVAEQIIIANFLSAIDDKISHTRKQIEKAEVWKKGLMQQMFC